MYLTGVRYGGVGPFQEATDLESLHLNGCSFGNRSCSSTVEVKLPRLALTGSSPYVSLREDASPSLRTGDLYEFCCKDADDDGNTVIVAVVDGGVGDVLDIVQIDDSDTKLTARCEVCGHKGFFTVRKTFDTRTELIGGVDVYICPFVLSTISIIKLSSKLQSKFWILTR
ncbi:unnamed protein product [Brassica oleracea]|uniref:Thymidine kinase n=1 Tax=Brassica napus TaxID=3708 RepID=A0A816JB38_BRANA|nr:unnamed protein product [Brassica napus]